MYMSFLVIFNFKLYRFVNILLLPSIFEQLEIMTRKVSDFFFKSLSVLVKWMKWNSGKWKIKICPLFCDDRPRLKKIFTIICSSLRHPLHELDRYGSFRCLMRVSWTICCRKRHPFRYESHRYFPLWRRGTFSCSLVLCQYRICRFWNFRLSGKV